ncbi:MAG: energy-coupling factor transporter transmembrane protein EcfT [Anaerolineae bacterium]|nr:energy-coupling factor transporter transmembrane protein EcfT [Anaerolineae bacterium]
MLKFQTVERDSFFTRLDFRPKLVMMAVITIVAFVWESPLLQVAMASLLIVAALVVGVKFSYIRLVITVMIPFYILLLLTHGFFNIDQVKALTGKSELTPMFVFPENWWLIGGGMMSWEGFLYGINAIFKTLSLVLVIPLGVFTTDVDTMIVGMVRARIPYKIAFIFSATLRFFPVLFQEIGMIIEAQRLRGLAMEKMNPIQRVRVYAKVAVPLILGAMVKSQQLEVVLQSKAFSGSPVRTYLHESEMRTVDYLLMLFFVLFFIAATVLYFVFRIGAFGGPI